MDTSADDLNESVESTGRGRKRRVDEFVSPGDPITHQSKRGRGGGRGGGGRGRGGGAQQRRSSAAQHDDGTADESSLFSMVKAGKALNTIIDDWIEEYEKNTDTALAKLQQLFISASGCKGVLSSVMLQQLEYGEIIRRMTEEFDEDSGDYPLIMSGPQWKKFRTSFSDFLQLLIEKCKQNIVFDRKMLDGVIRMLCGLADSQVRAFRHTATFAAMKLSSALVDIALELVTQKDRNSKQLETERAKQQKQRGGNERLEVLISMRDQIQEKTEDVRDALQYIFKNVFVHRYRDVLPDIRGICISELGAWMLVYPQHFLEDSFLKYIGWSLYDKVADVRLKCLCALMALYEREDGYSKLELFTNKFKDRLVSMVMDKEVEVEIKACQLITCIYRCFPDVLTGKDCMPIYDLVYCSNRSLAVTAGEFLNTKLFQTASGSNARKRSKKDGDNVSQLLDLVHFFIESECHFHAAYLVDALIDTNPMIKDWQSMATLLLDDDDVTDKCETQLIGVLMYAAKQAITGDVPVGRNAPKRAAATAREQRQLLDDKAQFSEVFIPIISTLLQKYIADAEKIANLLQLPLLFQLDMYLSGRLEKHLDDLIQTLETIIEKHNDDTVASSVAAIFEYLSTHVGVNQHTETARMKIIDGLSIQLRHNVQRFVDEEHFDEEDEAILLASFRKIAAFCAYQDLSKWDLWDSFYEILSPTDETKLTAVELREKALICCHLSLTWDLNRLCRDQDGNKQHDIEKLKRRRDLFLASVSPLLNENHSEMVYEVICDTLLLFNWKLSERDVDFQILVVHVSNDLQSKLVTFVIDNVFTDTDSNVSDRALDQQQQIELMHKRRSVLAQFCKLIMYGVLSVQILSNVLQYYTKYYTDFGDILKHCLNRCRDIDRIQSARAIVSALIKSFELIKISTSNGIVDPDSDDFEALRDLAKKLALTFGPDPYKNREAIATIHRDGIVFSLQDKEKTGTAENIAFLDILIEFSGKLIRPDKQSVMRYLDKYVNMFADSATNATDDPLWQPLSFYQRSLQDKNDDLTSVRSAATTTRGKGRGGRRGGAGRVTPTPSDMMMIDD